MSNDAKAHWSSYWSEGNLTSIPRLQSNYDGEILAFWEEQFALLKSDARVLDVCSGNGAVALLARDYSERHGHHFQIRANDAASIDMSAMISKYPKLGAHIQAIEFASNTLFEELEQDSDSIDLVTSQFGIEYTDLKKSAQQIRRILKPGGYFSLVGHVANSQMMEIMRRESSDFVLIEESGLFAMESKYELSDYSAKEFTRELDNILDTLHREAHSRKSRFLLSVGKALEPFCKLSSSQFQSGLSEFRSKCESLRFAQSRLSDVMKVEGALQQSPEWYKAFSDEGLYLIRSGDILQYGEQQVGSYCQFKKPA